MILQRLAEYYERLREEPETSKSLPVQGYSLQKVSFCVVVDEAGILQQFQDLRQVEGKRVIPTQLMVPGGAKSSGRGLNPGFLWDSASYLLGFQLDDKSPERTQKSFAEFRAKHLLLENEIQSTAFRAVCGFLRTWDPSFSTEYIDVLREAASNFGVFRLAGERRFVHEDASVRKFWEMKSVSKQESRRGFCLITGEIEPVARLHEPKIKGVAKAAGMGASIVSLDKPSFCSYGKDQGYNAPVGVAAVFRYTNALNHLLGERARRAQIGDATVVFWAEHATPFEGFVSDLFGDALEGPAGDSAESLARVDQVRLFLSQVRTGVAHSDAIDESDSTRFYVLGLGPNASRLCVRFWIDSTVSEIKERLGQHLRDIQLIGTGDGDPPLSIRRIVEATGRFKNRKDGYDARSVSPSLAAAFSRAVLMGSPYPISLLTALIGRIRCDGFVSHERVAAIKAILCRTYRVRGLEKEVSVGLDKDRREAGYVAGRLFAVLEKIQNDAFGREPNAGIKDRYFSSASATPAIVFPRLIKLSSFHLAKLEDGLKIYFEKLLGEIINKLECFPKFLPTEEQGLFIVGYFHQRQDLFTSKKQEGAAE